MRAVWVNDKILIRNRKNDLLHWLYLEYLTITYRLNFEAKQYEICLYFLWKCFFFWNEQINVLLKFWSVRDKWWNPYRLCLFNLIRISEAGKLDLFLIINSDRNCFPWNSFPVVDKPPWRFEGHTNRRHHQPGANAGFPAGGGADPSGGGANLRFCKKIPKPYEIEKILGRRGGVPGAPPLRSATAITKPPLSPISPAPVR